MASFKSINGFWTKNQESFQHWENLIDAWIQIHEDYAKKTDDAAYWYTERTNIGVLAQAAWKAGFIALEEYQSKKTSKINPESHSNGRCDLWLYKDPHSQIIEAKQQYVQLAHKRNIGTINKQLKLACDDATRTAGKTDTDIQAIGLAFLPMYIQTKSIEGNQISCKIATSLDFAKQTNAEVMAWCFPGHCRKYLGSTNENYIPGIIMVGALSKL